MGQEHDEPVDTDPETSAGWHPQLEGVEEVLVDLHRLGVACGGLERLLGEPRPLVDGVGQLAVCRADLHPGDDEVPALDEPGSVRCGRVRGEVSTGKSV